MGGSAAKLGRARQFFPKRAYMPGFAALPTDRAAESAGSATAGTDPVS